jgi:uncharacterized phage-associated protein
MYSAQAIANEFIKRAKQDGRNDLSPMKLQKLIYFAHGWYLANVHKALLLERVQAWKFGPVISSVYHDFKRYGNETITDYVSTLEYNNLRFSHLTPFINETDADAKEVIDLVWAIYGKYSSVQLSNMTHEPGTPWSIVTEGHDPIPSNLVIPDELIEECFMKELEVASLEQY